MEAIVFNSIEECIQSFYGPFVTVKKKSPVGGGDINEAYVLSLSNDEKVFVKANSIKNADFFRAEQEGLNAITSLGKIKTPSLLGRGVDKENDYAFLVMEYISGKDKIPAFWEVFGQNLAELHCGKTNSLLGDGKFGFSADNYIGATVQINKASDSWVDFFRDYRLEPQFKMAEMYFHESELKSAISLLDNLSDFLEEPKNPSLLHGDLWSGNYIIGTDGKAWLIDPAVYVGHAEADLAMTELFGRFPQEFYDSYSEINPISPDYKDRRDLYNLYHLLNHLNLFGASYMTAVMATMNRYV